MYLLGQESEGTANIFEKGQVVKDREYCRLHAEPRISTLLSLIKGPESRDCVHGTDAMVRTARYYQIGTHGRRC